MAESLREDYTRGVNLPRPVIFKAWSGRWYADPEPNGSAQSRTLPTFDEALAWLIENDPRRKA